MTSEPSDRTWPDSGPLHRNGEGWQSQGEVPSSVVLYTVGHSNQAIEGLLETLRGAGIALLVDIRAFPSSRRNPQFNSGALKASLEAEGIAYRHAPELGGRRKPNPDSTNTGLREPGFRAFADYVATPRFEAALSDLLALAAEAPTTIMCAESVPWHCHRSIISDAAVSRGADVVHLIGRTKRRHTLAPYARIDGGGRVSYPALL